MTKQDGDFNEKAELLKKELAELMGASKQVLMKGVTGQVEELFGSIIKEQNIHFGLIRNPKPDFLAIKAFFDSDDYDME